MSASSRLVELAVLTHRGRVREANEDAAGVAGWTLAGDEPIVVTLSLPVSAPVDVVVADGLGGHRGGAHASRTAVAAYQRALHAGAGLAEAVMAADAAVHEAADRDSGLRGMGTTLVAVRVAADGSLSVINVGDSRAYRLVGGYLVQLSEDDRAVGARSSLLQALGGERRVALEPHLFTDSARDGDMLLLCTDGLHDVLDEGDIVGLLSQPLAEAVSGLVAAALERGAPDNVTVVVMTLAQDDEPEPTEMEATDGES